MDDKNKILNKHGKRKTENGKRKTENDSKYEKRKTIQNTIFTTKLT